MNQTQVRYACKRVKEILAEKEREIRKEYADPVVASMTTEQKLNAIANGNYTVRKDSNKGYSYWYNCIVFNDQVVKRKDKKPMLAKIDKLRKEANRLIDEFMLGDAEEALKLLKKFENL